MDIADGKNTRKACKMESSFLLPNFLTTTESIFETIFYNGTEAVKMLSTPRNLLEGFSKKTRNRSCSFSFIQETRIVKIMDGFMDKPDDNSINSHD